MTQYSSQVEAQQALLEAEEWAKQIDWVITDNLDNTRYGFNYPREEKLGTCHCIKYNSGIIKCENIYTGKITYFGKRLEGRELLDKYLFG